MKSDNVELIKRIESNNNFKNWEIRTTRDSVIYSKGDGIEHKLKDKHDEYFTFVIDRSEIKSKNFNSVKIKMYSGYIVASDGTEVKEIFNNNDLIWLIGNVGNIYEAILLARLNGYWHYNDLNKYKVRKNKFILYVAKQEDCPEFGELIEPNFIYRPAKLFINKTGIRKIKVESITYGSCN